MKLDRAYVRNLQQVLPMKWMALHQFTKKSSMVEFFLPHFLYLLGSYMRCRYRLHYIAEEKEHLPELARYGMQSEILPTEINGGFEFDYREWLIGRKFFEAVRRKMKGRSHSTVDEELRKVVDAKRRLLGLEPARVLEQQNQQQRTMSADNVMLCGKNQVRSLPALYLTNKQNMSVPKKMKLEHGQRSNSAERIAECFRSTIVRTNWKPDEEYKTNTTKFMLLPHLLEHHPLLEQDQPEHNSPPSSSSSPNKEQETKESDSSCQQKDANEE